LGGKYTGFREGPPRLGAGCAAQGDGLAFLLLSLAIKFWTYREPLLEEAGTLLAVGVALTLRRLVRRKPEIQEATDRLTYQEQLNLEASVFFGLLTPFLLLVAVVLFRAP